MTFWNLQSWQYHIEFHVAKMWSKLAHKHLQLLPYILLQSLSVTRRFAPSVGSYEKRLGMMERINHYAKGNWMPCRYVFRTKKNCIWEDSTAWWCIIWGNYFDGSTFSVLWDWSIGVYMGANAISTEYLCFFMTWPLILELWQGGEFAIQDFYWLCINSKRRE